MKRCVWRTASLVMAAVMTVGVLGGCDRNSKEEKAVFDYQTCDWSIPEPARELDMVLFNSADTGSGDASARILQGVINKKQPRVYIAKDWTKYGVNAERVRQDILKTYGEVSLKELERDESDSHQGYTMFWTLFGKYHEEIERIFVFSDSVELNDTINVAAMLAGRYNGVAVDQQLADQIVAAGYDLPVVDVVEYGGFTGDNANTFAINQWISDNMVDDASKSLVVALAPMERGEGEKFLPTYFDFAVATNALIYNAAYVYLEKGQEIQKSILDQFPDNTPVVGWPNLNMEGDYVNSISACGKMVAGADWGVDNGSVWAAFPPYTHEEPVTPIPASYPVNNDEVYVAFMVSDGDAWHFASGDGKRYFKEQFGVDCRVLWLPDVFGYSASMPQILQKSGVDTFVTSKISWNDTDMMPHDTFSWKGIDGSEVFTYFLTAQDKVRGRPISNYTTYVGIPEPRQIMGTWDRYQDKHLNNEVLNTFGYGDGGGGPTAEHIEKIRRMNGGIQGCANARIDTASHFLDTLRDKALHNPRLAKWTGDLYLEFHRGTYTSIAKNKRNNRKGEYLMMNAEWLASMNRTLLGGEYPRQMFRDNWKILMVNQFHDIVPGSSIGPVYKDSDRQYAGLFREMGDRCAADADALKRAVGTEGGLLVANPNGFSVSAEVRVGERYVYAEDIPAKGYAVVRPGDRDGGVVVSAGDRVLENAFLRVHFDERYEMDSIFDKRAGREVLKPGSRGNRLIAFDDNCNYEFDAWEIKPYHTEKFWIVDDVQGVETVDQGGRAGFVIRRRHLDSTITQGIYLYGSHARLDVENDIDWHNHHLILKAEYPLAVNTDKMVCDIQFGALERATHRNTSWDEAKFEVCAHKYADLSESDYGVALLNDCKYGYAAQDGVLRLTLLKSATYPDPDADIGRHVFTYALYPHLGDSYHSDVLRQAVLLNNPLRAEPVEAQEGALPERYAFVECSEPAVLVETIKPGEDEGLIVRAYESRNSRCAAAIRFGFEVERVALCDLMEQEIEALPCEGRTVTLAFRPYEIQTIKVIPKI